MLAVPRALLDLLHLSAGSRVGLAIDRGRLIVEPEPQPRYVLEQLLAQCDPAAPLADEDTEWLGAKPVGTEIL